MATKPLQTPANDHDGRDANEIVNSLVSSELIFGVIGPVGSGTSEIAKVLQAQLEESGFSEVYLIKARTLIEAFAKRNGLQIAKSRGIQQTIDLQDAGDQMRKQVGHPAVAQSFAVAVRAKRADALGLDPAVHDPIAPDDTKRAYILDSIRHPSEILLLRKIYQNSFCAIGVVCEEEARRKRLREKYQDASGNQTNDFMKRDEKAAEKYGQQVSSAFHLSDFFIENTQDKEILAADGSKDHNPDWTVMDELGRLVDIMTHKRMRPPRPNETAMYHAHGARMRSSCLSRQVGAALLDQKGNILATGTNEVPRAGGGVYGGAFDGFSDTDPDQANDHRCFHRRGYCSNTKSQNAIIDDLFDSIDELPDEVNDDLRRRVRKTKIGQLIEFSRAVHAEMDALLSAAREGVSTVGSRLYVTTYPCHNCARHIVAAGVDEVQFIEPYLKSQALPLHGDAITDRADNWIPPSQFYQMGVDDRAGKFAQVLFRPFKGVAPRLYRRAFLKDRDLKNDETGDMLNPIPESEGESVDRVLKASYTQIENMFADTEQL